MTLPGPLKIAHFELSRDACELTRPEPPYEGVCVYFWHDRICLGSTELHVAQLPLSRQQLENIAVEAILPAVQGHLCERAERVNDRPLRNIGELTRCAPGRESVSVVVCTRDRATVLARCLNSLRNLSERPKEILVVDNSPATAATRAVVDRFPGVQYAPEARPGLSVARNTGLRKTTGDVIAFTDDDVVVERDWLTRLREPFARSPAVMAVAGLVLSASLDSPAERFFEATFSFNRGYRTRVFNRPNQQPWVIGAGANMALRRGALERVGPFDERLGAGAAGCSEDSEFWYRLLEAGFTCVYTPLAVVHHYHRADMDSLNQQVFAYMRGHTAALAIQFANHRRWNNLHRLGWTLPLAYLKRFRMIVCNGTAEQRVWRSSLRGFLSGLSLIYADSLLRSDASDAPPSSVPFPSGVNCAVDAVQAFFPAQWDPKLGIHVT